MQDVIGFLQETFGQLGFFSYGFFLEVTADFLTALLGSAVVLLPFIVVYGFVLWIVRGIRE